MTSSQWLDLAVLAIAFVAAVSGWRSGALGSVLSFVGVALGAIAGVLLAPHLIESLSGPRIKLFAALFLILAMVVIGEVAGVVLGRAVRAAIRKPAVRAVDSVVGVVLQLVVVMIAAWLLATPLTASDQPNLAAAVNDSRVLRQVDDLAPGWLKTVPRKLSAVLDDSGLPAVLEPFKHAPIAAVDAPDPELAANPVVDAVAPSVLRIRGVAPKCQKVLEGTGFVVSPDRVMTNAHVVAGADTVTVDSGSKSFDATVISFDPKEDIALLAVAGLPLPPLTFAGSPAAADTDALVLGYPGGGVFEATPARIRDVINLEGPDIYRDATVTRRVYTIRGTVQQGNSGGPMIDMNGRVLGVVFGAAVDDPETGFVMTAEEVASQLARIGDSQPASTQTCVGTE